AIVEASRNCATAAFLILLTLSNSAAAQETKCLEGRTAKGTCVDASLSTLARERTRVFGQPRLSYSGAAVAPRADRRYDALRDVYQGLRTETRGPCTVNFCP